MSHLPKELEYLEVVASALAEIPQDQLTEDVDMDALEAALRERLKGMKLRDAVSRLTEDHTILKRWLKEKDVREGPAFLISLYLMRPGPLARQLLAPPPPPAPTATMEVPQGWQGKSLPNGLNLEKGKFFCCVIIWDEQAFGWQLRDVQHREELQKSPKNPWANLGVWSRQSVKFGDCHGEKCLYLQSGSKTWKQVDYLLVVPGGFVTVRVGHQSGKDFNEADVEEKLHTLRVVPPLSSAH